jgi:hypothetical protein
VIIQTYASRPNLTDKLLKPKDECFTDSSFMLNGKRKAGYAVESQEEITEAWPLPAGTSAPKASLIALTRALTLQKEKRLNIYMASKYIFLVLYGRKDKAIPNKTWKGNPPAIGSYLPS